MKYAWFVAAIISARFIVTAIDFPPGDGDLAWQRWLGNIILTTHHIPRALGSEAFSAVGAPWTPQEWLFSTMLALAGERAWPLFAGIVALCPVSALLLTAYRAVRRGAGPLEVAFITAAVGTAFFDSFGVRVQVVAWPMLALFLLVLDNEGPWLWAAVPIAMLWSNLHASVMLAPILAGTVAFARLLEDRSWTPRVARSVLVSAAVGVAICCNPMGIELPLYALSLFASPIKNYISEWKPTDLGEYAFSYGAFPMLLCALALGVVKPGRKHAAADALLFAAFTCLLFFAARNIAIFAIVAAPMVACALSEVFAPLQRDVSTERIDRIMAVALPLFVAVLASFISFHLLHDPQRTELTMPFREIDAVAKMPEERRVLCADFAWCSYFLAIPHEKIFLDGRADPYPPAVWKDFVKVAYLRSGWKGVLENYRVDTVISARASALDQALRVTSPWKEVTHDQKFRLWVRKPL